MLRAVVGATLLVACTSAPRPVGPPPSPPAKPESTAEAPKSPQLDVACEPSGPWTTHPGRVHDLRAMRGPFRLLGTIVHAKGYTEALVVASESNTPTRVNLTGSEWEGAEIERLSSTVVGERGVVALRTKLGHANADGGAHWYTTDLEVAWWDAATGAAQLRTLPGLKEKPRDGHATAVLVDGGVVVHEHGATVRQLRDDGKTAHIATSSLGQLADALFVGKDIYLATTKEDRFAVSRRLAPASWTTREWSLAGLASFATAGGQPTLVVGVDGEHGVVPLGDLPAQPPPLVRPAPWSNLVSVSRIAVCASSDGAPVALRGDPSLARIAVTVALDGAPRTLETRSVIARLSLDGATCVDAFSAAGDGLRVAMVAGDPEHAWLTRSSANDSFEARPVRCSLPK